MVEIVYRHWVIWVWVFGFLGLGFWAFGFLGFFGFLDLGFGFLSFEI